MGATPWREGQRYDFPSLWAIPFLLIVAILVFLWVAMSFGLPGFIVALALAWWLEPKADAYVRLRDARNDPVA